MRGKRCTATPLHLTACLCRRSRKPLPKQHLVQVGACGGERRCISQAAVCLNPSEFGTRLAMGIWRCELPPASGPPKDGQPPQDSHSGRRACQRLGNQQKWRFRAAQPFRREVQAWPANKCCEFALPLPARATNSSWRTCTARTRVRHLTFDMRGAQKAQPFGHPLDGKVRARRCLRLLASNRDRLGVHRVVLGTVFQVRPASKNTQDFALAAALCLIVRFAV